MTCYARSSHGGLTNCFFLQQKITSTLCAKKLWNPKGKETIRMGSNPKIKWVSGLYSADRFYTPKNPMFPTKTSESIWFLLFVWDKRKSIGNIIILLYLLMESVALYSYSPAIHLLGGGCKYLPSTSQIKPRFRQTIYRPFPKVSFMWYLSKS